MAAVPFATLLPGSTELVAAAAADEVLAADVLAAAEVELAATDEEAAAADEEPADAELTAAPPPAALLPVAVAPVAAMRASRSAAVVHVTLVPAELTRGSAAQLNIAKVMRSAEGFAVR